jgi:tetratricopeptide (TPR) repeat protein
MFKLKRIPFLILPLFWVLLSLPLAGLAAEDPAAEELKKKAQQAFVASRYAEAAAGNLEIARKHPDSEARRYAVQMLGTLYENNLVDIKKAIKWHREFLEKYATPQQAPFYKEKLVSLEKLQQQKQDEAFATYQEILFANKGDEVMVERFEALLAKHPEFLLKAQVQRELGYAYARLDKRRESYQAFQDLSKSGVNEFSADDRLALEKADRHWLLTKVWGGIAWGVVAVLWVAALLMKPWERMTRASLRTFMVLALLWLLLAAARIPSFYAIDSSGDAFLFPHASVYIAAGLNLPVLFWLLLLTRGKFWQTRPRALFWASPPLTLAMTTAVFYLFLINQPNGAEIMDAFAAKYRHWATEWQKSGQIQSSKAGETS